MGMLLRALGFLINVSAGERVVGYVPGNDFDHMWISPTV
jgi:hypothetical protein